MSGYGAAYRGYLKALDDTPLADHHINKLKATNYSTSEALSGHSLSDEEKGRFQRLNSVVCTTDAIHIQQCVPELFRAGIFSKSIGYTVYESNSLPPWKVRACNKMDEIWTASDFNVETFKNAGVKVPIHTIPHVVETERFTPDTPPLQIDDIKDKFVFLSIFDFHWRKGWDVLFKAWWTAFSKNDDVVLIFKTFTGDDSLANQMKIKNMVSTFKIRQGFEKKSTAPARFIGKFMDHEIMPALYAASDCFVLPSRGEGWGLPYTEAMSMELPTIGTKWSGQLQFMNDENSYLIRSNKLIPIRDPYLLRIEPGYNGQRMADPDVEHLAQLMRHVYAHREEAASKGKIARQHLIDNFSEEVIARKIVARLQEDHTT